MAARMNTIEETVVDRAETAWLVGSDSRASVAGAEWEIVMAEDEDLEDDDFLDDEDDEDEEFRDDDDDDFLEDDDGDDDDLFDDDDDEDLDDDDEP